MPWIDVGEWAFDTDDVASVRRSFTAHGSPTGGPWTVADVTLSWGPRITLEGREAVRFLEEWSACTGSGWGAPGRRSVADDRPDRAPPRWGLKRQG
jgi:hypothetical protein